MSVSRSPWSCVMLCRGCATWEKSAMHCLQWPVMPKKAIICFFVIGLGIIKMALILSSDIFFPSWDMMRPKKVTSCLTHCNFERLALWPFAAKYYSSATVSVWHACSLSENKSKSSTHCTREVENLLNHHAKLLSILQAYCNGLGLHLSKSKCKPKLSEDLVLPVL